ncbi:ankyrin repeat-containing domain protein [Aspergillus heterothallicus]
MPAIRVAVLEISNLECPQRPIFFSQLDFQKACTALFKLPEQRNVRVVSESESHIIAMIPYRNSHWSETTMDLVPDIRDEKQPILQMRLDVPPAVRMNGLKVSGTKSNGYLRQSDPTRWVALFLQAVRMACKEGHERLAIYLMEAGADVQRMNRQGRSAVYLASGSQSGTLVQRLVQATRAAGGDPFQPDIHGYTPLYKAISCGNETVVRILIELGADLTLPDRHGRLSVHYSISCAGSSMFILDLVLRSTLERGGDLQCRSPDGGTLLHEAVMATFNEDATRYLLDAGADIMAIDIFGNTPLHRAASDPLKQHVVPLLIQRGADPTATNIF